MSSVDDFDGMAPRLREFYPDGGRHEAEFRLSRKLIIASRHWVTLIDGTLKAATGQNRARWQTLFAIAFADPPVTTLSLSNRLGVQWPTLVRTLAGLEKDGLIRRRDHPTDGRSRLLDLTSAGRDMLGRIQPVIDTTRHGVMSSLTDDQVASMTDLLDTIIDAIAAAPRSNQTVGDDSAD